MDENCLPPSHVLRGPATDVYRYRGLVDEVDAGRVMVTLWQHPGPESNADLDVTQHFGGVPPEALALFDAWAWTECGDNGEERHRFFARSLPRPQRPDRAERLDEIARILRGEAP